MSAKAETARKNNSFRAELRRAMELLGWRTWNELIRHWGLAERTGYMRIQHPETLTLRELRVLVAVLRLDEDGKARLMSVAL